MKRFTKRRGLLTAAALTMLVGSTASAAWLFRPLPDDLDLSLERMTDGGHYLVTMVPGTNPIRIGEMHSWTVSVTLPGDEPVDGAEITIDGGMPRHGHGLPTQPAVTVDMGDGSYRIDGMKFNMPGWWTLELLVNGTHGTDSVTFNLVL